MSRLLKNIESKYRAKELVMQYGWDSSSYQILNEGMLYWFSKKGDAVVGYVTRGKVRVVAGTPICSKERLADVISEFESTGLPTCYFGAEPYLTSILTQSLHHSMISIGSQAIWNPLHWPMILERKASLRGQINRARNKNVEIKEQIRTEALAVEIRRCVSEWLNSRSCLKLHFLADPGSLLIGKDRRFFVAIQERKVVGVLVLSPIPMRNGWLIEHIIRGKGAPNGTSECLIDSVMTQLGKEKCKHLSFGLAPLFNSQTCSVQRFDWIFNQIREKGQWAFNFKGLSQFKSKLEPEYWENMFVIANTPQFSIRYLYAIAGAFANQSPLLFILRSMLRKVSLFVINKNKLS